MRQDAANNMSNTDTQRIDFLNEVMGSSRNATEQTIKIYEDDATNSVFVKVGKSHQLFFGTSLRQAIDDAIKNYKE